MMAYYSLLDYDGMTPEQLHAAIDKLWDALGSGAVNGKDDVFTLAAKAIREREGFPMVLGDVWPEQKGGGA